MMSNNHRICSIIANKRATTITTDHITGQSDYNPDSTLTVVVYDSRCCYTTVVVVVVIYECYWRTQQVVVS